MGNLAGEDLMKTIAAHFDEAVQWRRALHRCPQPSWLEFFATGFVAEKLSEWGYRVLLGEEAMVPEKRLMVPDGATLEAEYQRALQAGIKEQFLAPARGGLTGAVAVLEGDQPGPTVAFRFDIDSNEVVESSDLSHRPAREGFASSNPGYAHMCGHDSHVAAGLLLARHFAENRHLIERGHLDDVDFLFGAHAGMNLGEVGQIALNVHSFLALSRFEVIYTGRPAHSGLRPNEGKNALLGACAAVTNLHAIPRHADGASRVNVGTLQAGTTWNVVPDRAIFRMETRGVTNEINGYMVARAKEVLEGAAKMYDLGLEIRPGAQGASAINSPELVDQGALVARSLPWVSQVVPEVAFNASEDVTLMMERVQGRGGKALFGMIGSPTFGGHHSSTFDVDELVIRNAAEFFAAMYAAIMDTSS